jgi:hypothetical protein
LAKLIGIVHNKSLYFGLSLNALSIVLFIGVL